MPPTLAEAIAASDNDHAAITAAFTVATGLGWHAPTPADTAGDAATQRRHPRPQQRPQPAPGPRRARRQRTPRADVEVIVIDDASTDATPRHLAQHRGVDPRYGLTDARRRPARPATSASTWPPPTHPVPWTPTWCCPTTSWPTSPPAPDPTWSWSGSATTSPTRLGPDGQRPGPRRRAGPRRRPPRAMEAPRPACPCSTPARSMTNAFVGHPLDDTRRLHRAGTRPDLLRLGPAPHGRYRAGRRPPHRHPRPSAASIPAFGAEGWGCDDTYLGAALIAARLQGRFPCGRPGAGTSTRPMPTPPGKPSSPAQRPAHRPTATCSTQPPPPVGPRRPRPSAPTH